MTTTIADTFRNPAGTGVGGVVVRATLVAASEVLTGGGAIIREAETTTASDGTWSLTLTPIASLLVAGGAYYLVTADGHRWTIDAPSDAGPHTLDAVMVVPGPLPPVGGVGGSGAVDSVNGHTGVVTLTASDVGAVPTTRTVNGHALSANVTVTATDVGLGNVNNTSDANKPISTATQTALDGKQPLDADLTAIAGLTATTDNVIQSVAGAWSSRTPAQLKATLALAVADVSGAAPAASPTFTGTATMDDRTQTGRTLIGTTALTDAATIAVDAALADHFTVTLGGNRTLGNPSNVPGAGQTQMIMFAIRQDATGSRTLTLGTAYRLGADIASVTLSTGANKTDYLGVRYNVTDAKWDVVAFVKGY